MSSIPASELVAVNPSVLGADGSALNVIGLILSTTTRIPIGAVPSFADADSVSSYFGASSQEKSLADKYFPGFNNAAKLPAALLFAQYPIDAVAAWLRGGDVSGLTLAELQAISGSLAVTVDGYARSASSVNLSSATSFSAAAALIQTALNLAAPGQATLVGSIAGTTLTVTTVSSGTIAAGQTLNGTGITTGTLVLEQLTGSAGGTGTYTVNNSQTIGSENMTTSATPVAVTYDSVSGGFVITSGVTGDGSTIATGATGTIAATLELTLATGALASQGADAASPSAFMTELITVTTDWVTFMTAFDPDDGDGNDEKLAFAAWKDTQNNRYAYVCWDTDVTPTNTLPATTSLGYLLSLDDDSGTCLLDGDPDAGWDDTTGPELAAFVCGAAASIDFQETNGRITFAYKAQDGLLATVITASVATNLGGNPQAASRGNGYNFYGTYGPANDSFTWFQRGFCTGAFLWLDSYINQIVLNNSFQNALLALLQNARSIPYTVAGQAMIENALADPIAAALNFGTFGPGPITSAQAAIVNAAAGATVAGALQTQGYYLQVKASTAAVRAARTSPPATFWYIDRGAVQSINLASVALQ